MSDNFVKVARQEIQSELSALQEILLQCNNDNDISKLGNNIGKHLHKIKGLAPMMDQISIGEIAKMNDSIIKHIIENGRLDGIYQILLESTEIMKAIFDNSANPNISDLKHKIYSTFPTVFNK